MNTPITPSPNGPKHVYFGERGYLELMADIMAHGCDVPDRTGVGRRKLFDQTLRFDLREGFPSFTVRNTPPKFAFEEFWAFLNGIVHIHPYLSAKGIDFWKGNTTREFLDKQGLTKLPVGHLGKSYGFQIRHSGGELDAQFNPQGGVDQLARLINNLSSKPFDSRHLIDMWNPQQEAEMSLPPCWYNHQFLVTLDKQGNKVLNLGVTARSADLLFGTPFNVQQYAIYLASTAKLHNMIAGELSCRLMDAHVYGKQSDFDVAANDTHPSSQFHYVRETLSRDFYETPVTFTITKDLNTLADLLSMTYDDLVFEGYHPNTTPYQVPRPAMAV